MLTQDIEKVRSYAFQHEALTVAAKVARDHAAKHYGIDDPDASWVFKPTVRLVDLQWVIAVYPHAFADRAKDRLGFVE